uniref:Uncharacterized protein n=1 Tax=Onchocerca volvulus TaxID=6282 RepID=A0A8R1XMI1_ONCVO
MLLQNPSKKSGKNSLQKNTIFHAFGGPRAPDPSIGHKVSMPINRYHMHDCQKQILCDIDYAIVKLLTCILAKHFERKYSIHLFNIKIQSSYMILITFIDSADEMNVKGQTMSAKKQPTMMSFYDSIDNNSIMDYANYSIVELLYNALKKSVTSKQSFRMTATDSASNNSVTRKRYVDFILLFDYII